MPWVRFAFGNVFQISYTCVFIIVIVSKCFPQSCQRQTGAGQNKTRSLIAKKLLNNLGRKKEITLSRNFETKMKVSSLKVGAQRLRFIWKHGVQKGSKGTHLENPINFRALLTGKSAFKVLFHHAITPRIDIFDFISDKKNKWGKVKIKPSGMGPTVMTQIFVKLRLIWVRGQWKWNGQGTYILNRKWNEFSYLEYYMKWILNFEY